ncbi:hypothetical protein [Streptomyces sp. NPDC002553]|uniref:hypothetical protein n=1 Tax=Streptomyces sp. NPDC002553 TaxID=3154417 RepID=UPI00331B5CC1
MDNQPNPERAVEARFAAHDTTPSANRYLTNDEGVPLLCAYIPGHAHRGVYATGRLPAGPMGTVAACDDCQADHARYTARLGEITAGARPTSEAAAQRVRAWTDAMADRTTYGISVPGLEPLSVSVAGALALAEHTSTSSHRDQLRAAVAAYLTHATGEPRTLAPSHGTRPPLFTYDLLVLLDQQEPTQGEGDGLTCPNGNRPPECTELDPCEACAQDTDTEAEEIEASMGLREPATHDDDQKPMDAYEVTVLRTEMITFTLTAVSAQDAKERYLLDGEETCSKTVELRVDCVTRQQGQEPTRPV